ncbi:MAG: hypothetical protein JWN50_646 [Parcubacteria group bacterium]|nr:hypothetical protein [Parcubacteria group bacterium]
MDPQTPTQTPPAYVPPSVNPYVPPVTAPPAPPAPSMPPVSSVPPIPPSNIGNNGNNHGKETRVILPALLLVLIIVGGYYWYASRNSGSQPAVVSTATTTPTATGPAAGVEVAKTDLTPGVLTKLPAGFPASIPVEQATITESYKAVYTEHGVTQYTVTYTSTKTKDALWKIYTDFGTAQGYKINATSTDKTKGVLDLQKGNNELNAVITAQGGSTLVQLNYVERQ